MNNIYRLLRPEYDTLRMKEDFLQHLISMIGFPFFQHPLKTKDFFFSSILLPLTPGDCFKNAWRGYGITESFSLDNFSRYSAQEGFSCLDQVFCRPALGHLSSSFCCYVTQKIDMSFERLLIECRNSHLYWAVPEKTVSCTFKKWGCSLGPFYFYPVSPESKVAVWLEGSYSLWYNICP